MSLIANTFFANARHTPDKLAVWCEGRSLTYAELSDLVTRFSLLLTDKGVQQGDHLALLLPNCVEFIALMLSAAHLGVALVPLNPDLPGMALGVALQASDVKHVIGTAAALAALTESGVKWTDGIWFCLDRALPNAEWLTERAEQVRLSPLPESDVAADTPFILTMTSGSTGAPKGIVLTQRTKFNRAEAARQLYGVTANDRILAATPLYHSLAERLVLLPLLVGGTSILMARFSPSRWLSTVREQSVTFTIAVSSQLRQIADLMSESTLAAVKSLRCIVSSSALIEESVKQQLVAHLRCEFHECYGTSEIAIATNLDPVGAKSKLASVGRPAPGVDVRILADDGTPVAAGTAGEIACRTPMLFGGYYKRPDLTALAMAGDYFRTGDVGRLDDDGYLYFLGRTKDIIISGGINVYPSDIEAVVAQSGFVAECAAFPFPDANLGEVVALAIVLKPGASFDQRALRFLCARELADFQQPRKYFVIDQLPRNSMGKLMKHMLVKQLVSPA